MLLSVCKYAERAAPTREPPGSAVQPPDPGHGDRGPGFRVDILLQCVGHRSIGSMARIRGRIVAVFPGVGLLLLVVQ